MKKLAMSAYFLLVVFVANCVSGCVSFGRQELFDFKVVYYMDGTCEIQLPNRNGVFNAKGKFYSDNNALHRVIPAYVSDDRNYSIVCDLDKKVSHERSRIRRARTSIRLALGPKHDEIKFTDENHITLDHVVEDPWMGPLSDPDRYRFIQGDNDVFIDTRAGASKRKNFKLDEYFSIVDGYPANYDIGFSFKFPWGSAYGRQLPGVTIDFQCDATFSATNVSVLINGRKSAAESGIYALVEGENGKTASNSCK